jgi:drug/metabolite transporter (DMT)-like permease
MITPVDVILALVAALLFALGTVLQQKAGLDEPSEGASSSLLLRMAQRPVWLMGIAADVLGFFAQAAALGLGRLAVVQPLLVLSVVFALPLGARLTGQRITRTDVGAAVLVVTALVVFLAVADPSGGRDDAPFGEWLIAGGAGAGACAALILAARGGSAPRRAALLGIATGVLFGFSAALTKSVVDQLDTGVFEVFLHWNLYALIVVGYSSMTLNQLALNSGALAPAIATSMSFDPITSVVLGLTLLDESLHSTTIGSVATLAALAAALAGMAILARTQSQTTTTKPLSAPATA